MEWLTSISGVAWDVAKPVVAVLVAALVAMALKKLGISLSAEKQAELEKTVMDLIVRAEELKANGSLGNASKLGWVIDETLKKKPGMQIQDVADVVHSVLPRLGLGAAAKGKEGANGSPR